MNLLTDNLYQLLAKISIPAGIALLFSTIYNLIDTYFAGTIDAHALAGISLVFPLFTLILAVSNGMTSGIGAVFGNAVGAKDNNYARQVAYNGYVISFIVSIFVMIFGFIISPFIINLLTNDLITQQYSSEFINIMFLGTLTFTIPGMTNALLIALGDTKTYRNILIFGALANVVLDYAFIFILHLGIVGIAVSTIFIQLLQTIYLLYVLNKKEIFSEKSILNIKNFNVSICKDVLKNGIPPAFNMLLFSLGLLIYNYYIALAGGDLALAGFGIGYRIEQLVLLPVMGIGSATLAIIAQNNGSYNKQRVQETFYKALKISIIISIVGSVLIFIFKSMVMGIFTTDEAVIIEGLKYLQVEIFVIPMYAILTITTSALQALKKPNLITVVTIFRQIILPVTFFTLAINILHASVISIYVLSAIISYIVLIGMYFITIRILKKDFSVDL